MEDDTILPSSSARILLAALMDDWDAVSELLDKLERDELRHLFEVADVLRTKLHQRITSSDTSST